MINILNLKSKYTIIVVLGIFSFFSCEKDSDDEMERLSNFFEEFSMSNSRVSVVEISDIQGNVSQKWKYSYDNEGKLVRVQNELDSNWYQQYSYEDNQIIGNYSTGFFGDIRLAKETFTYNNMQQLESKIYETDNGIIYITNYKYINSLLDRVDYLNPNFNQFVNFHYNGDTQLDSTTEDNINLPKYYTYNSNSLIVSECGPAPENYCWRYIYNSDNQLIKLDASSIDFLTHSIYEYDNIGRLIFQRNEDEIEHLGDWNIQWENLKGNDSWLQGPYMETIGLLYPIVYFSV